MNNPDPVPPPRPQAPPHPARPPRRLPVVGLIVGAAAAVVAVAVGTWTVVNGPGSANDAQLPSTSSTPSTTPPRTVAIVAPDMLGNRPKNTDTESVRAAQESAARFDGMLGTRVFVSAYYGSDDTADKVLINAVGTRVPEGVIDIVLRKSVNGPDTRAIKAFASVDARPLGGVAKCGEFEVKGVQTSVCGWSDQDSMGIVIWYRASMERAAGEFAAVRAAIEQVT